MIQQNHIDLKFCVSNVCPDIHNRKRSGALSFMFGARISIVIRPRRPTFSTFCAAFTSVPHHQSVPLLKQRIVSSCATSIIPIMSEAPAWPTHSGFTHCLGCQVFAQADPAYARRTILHARALLDFADAFRGLAGKSVPALAGVYNSTAYRDDLAWAAAWLYVATGEESYRDRALGFLAESRQHEADR